MKGNKPKEFDAGRIMMNNCWKRRGYHNEDRIQAEYRAEFTGRHYSSEVAALVSENDDGLWEYSHYGVVRLEVFCSPRPPYEWYELEDAQVAIELAEDNLLRIGMPFEPDFVFHGRNKANQVRRNLALRKKYGMDAIEKEKLKQLSKEVQQEYAEQEDEEE
jgi:hypothetical protein